MTVLLFGWTTLANAADPAFSTPQGEEVEKAETHLTGELGGTYTTGNTNLYTVNGLVTFSHKVGKNKLSVIGGANLGAAVVDLDGNGIIEDADRDAGYEPNAKRIYTDARYDRFLSDKDSLYLLAGLFSDGFAGYDLRAHEQIGYARLLVNTEKAQLKAEFGVDWAQEDYVPEADLESSVEFVAARVLGAANYKVSDSVGLAEVFEVYENVLDPADLRVLNTASVTSALSKHLSLKVSHNLIFDNVPVEGFQKLDQTTMMTLVVTLL